MVSAESFKSGLTNRSFLAAIYAMVVFIPATMYMELMGGGGGVSVAWFMLILWAESARLTGKPLTRQEACLVFLISATAVDVPLGIVFADYYRNSDIARSFGLTDKLPDWYAPAPATGVHDLRTLLHPAWIPALSLIAISTVAGSLSAMALGLLAREVYIEAEDLPFPLLQVDAMAVETLTGRDKMPRMLISVFVIIGFAYGLLLYALPLISESWTGRETRIIPIPWVDWTNNVTPMFPGATIGIMTDIIPYISAFILPFKVVLGMFIGSLAIRFFGNWITVANWEAWGLPDVDPAMPGVQSWWTPGMPVNLILQRCVMYLWMCPAIGLALSLGIGPIMRHPGMLKRSFASLMRFKGTAGRRTDQIDPLSPKVIVSLLIVSHFIVYGAIFAILAPDYTAHYPWVIAIIFALPLASMIIEGRMIGEVGISGGLPESQIRNLLFTGTAKGQVPIWFVPSPGGSGMGWLRYGKISQMTNTSMASIIKGWWLLVPISVPVGYLFVEMFWKIAPIPSGRFPGVSIFWPISATTLSIWLRGPETELFHLDWIGYFFVAGVSTYLFLDFLHIPRFFTALIVGSGLVPHYGLSVLIGGIIGQVAQWKIGEEWWKNNRRLIVAGVTIGESVAVAISVALALIIKSLWFMPF